MIITRRLGRGEGQLLLIIKIIWVSIIYHGISGYCRMTIYHNKGQRTPPPLQSHFLKKYHFQLASPLTIQVILARIYAEETSIFTGNQQHLSLFKIGKIQYLPHCHSDTGYSCEWGGNRGRDKPSHSLTDSGGGPRFQNSSSIALKRKITQGKTGKISIFKKMLFRNLDVLVPK